MKRVAIVLSSLLIVIAGFWIYSSFTYPTTSPINVISFFIQSKQHPHKNMEQQTVAFLPYWRMDDLKYARFDLLSGIIYFSLYADENGQFVKVVNNETDPGYRWWSSQVIKDLIAKTQINGGKFSLTIAMQKNKTLKSLLNNKNAQKKLIENLLTEVESRHLDGINVDFEYDGEPEEGYQQKFTGFAQDLTSSFKTNSPKTELSIDFFPLSVREPRLFDIKKLSQLFDRIVVMSYDYYSSTSDIAGPVAPMGGFKEQKYFFDIKTTYEDYLKFVPKEKLVMGVPYYGYDWAVENGQKIQSKTLPISDPNNYAAVISYARAKENKDLKQNQCQWDDFAKEKWCWYKDEKNIEHQVWIEDNKSIEEKFNFAKKNKFSGIAIWTLGYDKQYPDLWNLIEKIFVVKVKP